MQWEVPQAFIEYKDGHVVAVAVLAADMLTPCQCCVALSPAQSHLEKNKVAALWWSKSFQLRMDSAIKSSFSKLLCTDRDAHKHICTFTPMNAGQSYMCSCECGRTDDKMRKQWLWSKFHHIHTRFLEQKSMHLQVWTLACMHSLCLRTHLKDWPSRFWSWQSEYMHLTIN